MKELGYFIELELAYEVHKNKVKAVGLFNYIKEKHPNVMGVPNLNTGFFSERTAYYFSKKEDESKKFKEDLERKELIERVTVSPLREYP